MDSSTASNKYLQAVFSTLSYTLLSTLETAVVFTWREIANFDLAKAHIPVLQQVKIPMILLNMFVFVFWMTAYICIFGLPLENIKTVLIIGMLMYSTSTLVQSIMFGFLGYKLYRKVRQQEDDLNATHVRRSGRVSSVQSVANRILFCGICIALLLACCTAIWLVSLGYSLESDSLAHDQFWPFFASLVLELLILLLFIFLYTGKTSKRK
jgi:hypothetical protein